MIAFKKLNETEMVLHKAELKRRNCRDHCLLNSSALSGKFSCDTGDIVFYRIFLNSMSYVKLMKT